MTLHKNSLDTSINNIVCPFFHRVTCKNHQFGQTPQSINEIGALKVQRRHNFLPLLNEQRAGHKGSEGISTLTRSSAYAFRRGSLRRIVVARRPCLSVSPSNANTLSASTNSLFNFEGRSKSSLRRDSALSTSSTDSLSSLLRSDEICLD